MGEGTARQRLMCLAQPQSNSSAIGLIRSRTPSKGLRAARTHCEAFHFCGPKVSTLNNTQACSPCRNPQNNFCACCPEAQAKPGCNLQFSFKLPCRHGYASSKPWVLLPTHPRPGTYITYRCVRTCISVVIYVGVHMPGPIPTGCPAPCPAAAGHRPASVAGGCQAAWDL